jgi:hypothetical protein
MFDSPINPGKNGEFPATDWAVIFTAGTEDPGAHPAMVRICELYWQPIYHFIRRTWPAQSADEALEATHDFFALRLERHDIKDLNPQKGLFRNWLRSAVNNSLRNTRRSSLREREKLTSLDAITPEERLALEPRTALDPWLLLEHDLALGILERALAKLEQEHAARGHAELVRQARHLLVPGEGTATYAELEERWGLSRESLKVKMYTMRRRLDTLICSELGVPPDDDDARERELAWLFQAIALKEEQPCAKTKALPPQRPMPR